MPEEDAPISLCTRLALSKSVYKLQYFSTQSSFTRLQHHTHVIRTHESTLHPSKYQSSLSRVNDSPAGSFSFLVSVIGAPGMIVKTMRKSLLLLESQAWLGGRKELVLGLECCASTTT